MNNSEFSRQQLEAMYDDMADRAFQEHKKHLDALAASHKEVQDAHDMCEWAKTVSSGPKELQQKALALLEERLQGAWADYVTKHEAYLNFLKSPKFTDEAIRPCELALEKLRRDCGLPEPPVEPPIEPAPARVANDTSKKRKVPPQSTAPSALGRTTRSKTRNSTPFADVEKLKATTIQEFVVDHGKTEEIKTKKYLEEKFGILSVESYGRESKKVLHQVDVKTAKFYRVNLASDEKPSTVLVRNLKDGNPAVLKLDSGIFNIVKLYQMHQSIQLKRQSRNAPTCEFRSTFEKHFYTKKPQEFLEESGLLYHLKELKVLKATEEEEKKLEGYGKIGESGEIVDLYGIWFKKPFLIPKEDPEGGGELGVTTNPGDN